MATWDDKGFSRFLDDLAARGLEVMLTELDCIDKGAPSDIGGRDAAVAAACKHYLDVSLANRAVTTVINWGLSDRNSWVISGGDPLAKRDDGLRPQPLPFGRPAPEAGLSGDRRGIAQRPEACALAPAGPGRRLAVVSPAKAQSGQHGAYR